MNIRIAYTMPSGSNKFRLETKVFTGVQPETYKSLVSKNPSEKIINSFFPRGCTRLSTTIEDDRSRNELLSHLNWEW